MNIIGAGMAGLLAGAMMRHAATAIHEAQPELPNNHTAVLRFRSPVVGEALNIPFKQVNALKALAPWQNPIADALAYSAKTNGTHTLRSIMTADGRMATRYIAPEDLVSRMAAAVQCPINFNAKCDEYALREMAAAGPVVSTIPMPALMKVLGWEAKSEFKSRAGINIVGTIPGASAYCSLYVPDPLLPFSRISITGDKLIVECSEEFMNELHESPNDRLHKSRTVLLQALHMMGLDGVSMSYEALPQKYAKVLPIDEAERREFIMWASTEHNIYSLGRFATWRPGLLMDDVVNDVRVIQRLTAQRGEAYSHKLKD